MNEINQLFFELIQVAIGTRICLSHMPTSDEWGELYAMAKKQSLVGVCFAGVQNLGANADDGYSVIGIPEMLYLTWMGMGAKIQQRNEVINIQCRELSDKLEADGLEHCIMKGQQIGCYYGELAALRQSGDIDVWEASADARSEMCKEIEVCGMMTFTRAMMYAMEKVLGMPKEKMICEGNREDGELLLNLIMDDSNADAQEKRRRTGEKESAFGRFVRVQKLNMRLIRIAPMEVFWTPLWRIWNWCWMKSHGYVYSD